MGVIAVAPLHVLAVDDSNLDRKLIERLLKTFSYHVTAVDSGSKALEFLGLQDDEKLPSFASDDCRPEVVVNLIITDYCMTGMTGFELLRKIKESTSLKEEVKVKSFVLKSEWLGLLPCAFSGLNFVSSSIHHTNADLHHKLMVTFLMCRFGFPVLYR